MNTTPAEGNRLTEELLALIGQQRFKTNIMIAPPFTHLAGIAELITGAPIALAAQNVSAEPKGAFTGEVSAAMLQGLGVEAVIVGHSERRAHFQEQGKLLQAKLERLWELHLLPILCVGESLAERESGEHRTVVEQQLAEALQGKAEHTLENLVIAYEPVWAIGTGRTASPEQAQEMHHFIRKFLSDRYSATLADEISLLYGGSVKPNNAHDLFGQPDVDGGLIGGASLSARDFYALIQEGDKVL